MNRPMQASRKELSSASKNTAFLRYPYLFGVLRSWWVALIILLTFGVFEQASRALEKDIEFLNQEIDDLENKINEYGIVQKDLAREVASQNDPAWVELTLVRVLGLIPYGYTKVYLVSEGEDN